MREATEVQANRPEPYSALYLATVASAAAALGNESELIFGILVAPSRSWA